MRTVKIFIKAGCSRCPQAKQAGAALKDEGFSVTEFDVGTTDGLAEGAYYSVQATPTFIIEDQNETIIGDFRGDVPPVQTLRDMLTGS
jgi:protein-disulfide isomerase